MYRIKTSRQAEREIKKLKKIYRAAISQAIEDIKDDPYIGKPLIREHRGRYSYRIRVYRIIYTINMIDKTVYIISAGHRATVYD